MFLGYSSDLPIFVDGGQRSLVRYELISRVARLSLWSEYAELDVPAKEVI